MKEVAKSVKEVAKLVNQEPTKRTHPENERGHHISEVATDKKYPPRPDTESITLIVKGVTNLVKEIIKLMMEEPTKHIHRHQAYPPRE